MHNRFITATAAPYTLVVMSNPRATIREVAEAAGVSRATVSYALDGGRVSAETRARIQAVAVRLNYRPHRTARGLRMGRSRTLGLMLPAPTDGRAHPVSRIDFYLDLALAAATAAFERDHGLLLLPSALAGNLDQVGVDGMLICNPESGDVRIASVEAAGVPVVTIDRDLARPSHRRSGSRPTRAGPPACCSTISSIGEPAGSCCSTARRAGAGRPTPRRRIATGAPPTTTRPRS